MGRAGSLVGAGYHRPVSEPIDRLLEPLVAVATIIVIMGIAVVPFLTPAWIGFEQDQAQATAWTGFSTADVRAATDAILVDLVFGPPDFDVEVQGEAVLSERERGHLRDVRGVFGAFAGLAVVSVLVAALGRGALTRDRWRRAVRRGATWTAVGIVIAGIVAVTAFEAAFEVFHRLLFSGGSYTFDPRTDRLVQLFPYQFWLETTLAVGVVIVVLALAVRRWAGAPVGPSALSGPSGETSGRPA